MKRLTSIALVFAVSLTMTAIGTSAQAPADDNGHWEGTIKTPDRNLPSSSTSHVRTTGPGLGQSASPARA
jgi:hypothetical protein